MKSGLLSTVEVSHMLKVNESTVKRWTDKGTLKCIKTPGGHRKYKMKDVVSFMDQFEYDITDLVVPTKAQTKKIAVSTDYAILTKNFASLANFFLESALEGIRENTFQLLSLLYTNRISQIEIFDKIIFPAFHDIGIKWMKKEIGVEQEHIASNTALHAILRLQDNINKKPNHGLIALCGCIEDEYHEMGITCVANALEVNGWTTYYLGANVPTSSFVDAIVQYSPDVVCISSTIPKTQRQL